MDQSRDASIARVGVVLAVLALVQLLLAWLTEPRWAWGLGGTMAAELVTGRETAIPIALDQGVPPWWIAMASILQNLALAALIVPAAMAAVHSSEQREGFFPRLLGRIHKAAERNQHRAGTAWGIFVFMLVPFLANGPIIAGIVGRLIGADLRRLALAVVAAVILTATAWAYLYATLVAALTAVDPRLARLPALVALAVTGIAFVVLIRDWRTERN